jgi:RNA polymerase sigma-70 factor (sigma-E family)
VSAVPGQVTDDGVRLTMRRRDGPKHVTGVVDGARAGSDDEEFAAFVAANHARMLHVAELLTGDRGRAEDLLQNVLIRTYLRWPKIRQDNPLAYVRAALANARTDWWRRASWRERPTSAMPDIAIAADHAGPVVRRDAVLRALAALTARERAVVVLRYYEQLSEAEIAATLGIAAGTVKSTCARALGKLRISPELAPSARDGSLQSSSQGEGNTREHR